MSIKQSHAGGTVFSLSVRDEDIPVVIPLCCTLAVMCAIAQFVFLFDFGDFTQTLSKIDATRELIKAPQNGRFSNRGR